MVVGPLPLGAKATARRARSAGCFYAPIRRTPRLDMIVRLPVHPMYVRTCVRAGKFCAADVFDHKAGMAALRARCLAQLAGSGADILLVPTALNHWTIAELQVGP